MSERALCELNKCGCEHQNQYNIKRRLANRITQTAPLCRRTTKHVIPGLHADAQLFCSLLRSATHELSDGAPFMGLIRKCAHKITAYGDTVSGQMERVKGV